MERSMTRAATGRPSLLIVDDDESVLIALETILAEHGDFYIKSVEKGETALALLAQNRWDVALVDLKLQDIDGLEVLKRARAREINTEIIMITGHGSIDTAKNAIRLGAYDYLQKPVDSEEILQVVHRALEKHRLLLENRSLQEQINTLTRYQDLIGKSPVMQELYRTIEAVSTSAASVLILGESGTGKELVAHAIHKHSPRAEEPFIAVNCAALPVNILESELFGHEKGAFTGAIREKQGFFEQADRGTIFLDEVTEMPFELQAKLLRVLETRRFRKVGGQRELQVDVRILAATNRTPQQAIIEKKLREDLYYRLAVVEVDLPALRDRAEDIPLLAMEFLNRFAAATGKIIEGFAPETMEILLNHDWPGNVRELRNAIERAVILNKNGVIQVSDLPPRMRQGHVAVSEHVQENENRGYISVRVGTTVAEAERMLILRTLEMCNNNKTHAARVLGISLKTLHNKLARYGDGAK